MQRTWILLMIPFMLVLAACAPAARAVPAAEPVFYAAAPLDVMGTAIEAISTSPGVDDSTGWLITDADTQGGFVRAETEVTTSGSPKQASARPSTASSDPAPRRWSERSSPATV